MLTPTPAESVRFKRRLSFFLAPIALALLWVASGLFIPPQFAERSAQLQGLVTTFLGIFIEALPFLLAGVIASIAIQEWMTPAALDKLTGRGALNSALRGSLLGLLFPVCECGAIPASRRLLRKGAPAPLGIAFALAAPVVNPVVIISTMVAFDDWRWAAGRVGLTILIAVLIGIIIGAGTRREAVLADTTLHGTEGSEHVAHSPHASAAACGHPSRHSAGSRWQRMLSHGSVELIEMSQYLVLGALLAATMQTFIPQSLLLNLTAEGTLGIFGPLLSILILMAIAVLLSVCSTVDAFLALAFLGLFHPGAVMAFLIFGPMIDIKSTLMLGSTFQKPAVASMVLLSVQFSAIAGLATFLLMR